MKWIDDMLTRLGDAIDLTPLLPPLVIIGVVLIMFQMQYADKLERISGTGPHHGPWTILTRAALALKMFSMFWAVIYGYEKGWLPWPPFVAIIASLDFYVLCRVMVLRTDIKDQEAGHREVSYRSKPSSARLSR